MKKILLFFFSLFLFSAETFAQNSKLDSLNAIHGIKRVWHFSISTGYGMPIGGMVLGTELFTDDRSNPIATYKNIIGTYGEGSWSFGEITCMFRPHFGLLAGAYYFFGKAQRNYFYEDLKSSNTSHDETKVSIQSPGPQLGFIFSDTLKHRFILTCQSAFLTGIGNKATVYNYHDETPALNNWNKTSIEFQGLSFGWVNRVGVSFKFGQRWETGIEGFAVIESWGPRKGKVIFYNVNGVNNLDSLPQDEREYTLVNSVTYNSMGMQSTGVTMKTTYPFHSAGILVRVSYRFK